MFKRFSNSLLSKRLIINVFSILIFSAFIVACGGSENAGEQTNGEANKTTSEVKSSKEFTTVTTAEIGKLDGSTAQKGKELFEAKCTACHKYDTRLVGPALGEVTKRRTPEYIISMITHPDEMIKNNDTVKALLQQYMTPMTNQNVTLDDAKAIYEHLKSISNNL